MTAVYETSPLKRYRRTNAELADLNETILEVCAGEHPATVRRIFYLVESLGAVEKTEAGYQTVQREVLKLRRSRALPYEWIADGSRWHVKSRSWRDAEHALTDAVTSYRRALWQNQGVYVEVWSEKDAISEIVSEITDPWDVPLMIARGFSSETFLWKTAETINNTGKTAVIYNLGDHDLWGVDAWIHVQDKLRAFVAPDIEIIFERLAVTPMQIRAFDLPTRPPKTKKLRGKTAERAEAFGPSIEVDAMPTQLLQQIVRESIERWIDPHALEVTEMVEQEEREGLQALLAGWSR
jgi:hypothetical protein